MIYHTNTVAHRLEGGMPTTLSRPRGAARSLHLHEEMAAAGGEDKPVRHTR